MVVRQSTGVVYEQQCACVTNDARLVEGFYVPLGGAGFVLEEGLDQAGLTAAFHAGSCDSSPATGASLSPAAAARLHRAVETIPCWLTACGGREDKRLRLTIDATRLDEAVEAWVPVETPLGPGVLLYQNCD